MLHQLVMAFSVRRTIPILLNFDDNANDEVVYCIYGLKGLATILLYFSFKFLQIGHLTFTNRAHLTEVCLISETYRYTVDTTQIR